MKTMKQLLLLLPIITVAMCAQAQQRVAAYAGQDYTIGNLTAASGSSVTYQWFRDGAAIANATSATYTVPANLAKHDNGLSADRCSGSIFQRAAYGIDCPGAMAMSNTITIYFCDLVVNGVCWARANSDNYGRINPNPWDYGYFYQWNRPTVTYGPTSPADGVAISSWNSTPDYAAEWTSGFPCPMGWRLPTSQDFYNLHAMSQPAGGIWLSNQARGLPAGVNGRLYGYNTAYCTMTNMVGCVFLPAVGNRSVGNGSLSEQGTNGYYWSGTQASLGLGYRMGFTSSNSNPTNSSGKATGRSIRCVQDVGQSAVQAN